MRVIIIATRPELGTHFRLRTTSRPIVTRLQDASVSVRRVLESYESVVIQGWWPDSRRVTDVDAQEPRTLRPQQVAIPEGFDRRRMEANRTFDHTWQARRRQTDGDHAGGDERPHVRSLNWLSVARDPERPAAEKHDLRLFRSVDL